MNRLFPPATDPTSELQQFPTEERGGNVWYLTPYGAAFSPCRGDLWSFRYDAGLPRSTPAPDLHGVMHGADVANSLHILGASPDLLRVCPPPMRELEELTGETAVRKDGQFGAWRLSRSREFSLFNNPFGVTLGYTDAADNFEVWFSAFEDEPRGYVSLEALRHDLRQYGFARDAAAAPAPPPPGDAGHACAACGAPTRRRCARCRAAYYCGPACQTGAWPAHRAACRPASDGA